MVSIPSFTWLQKNEKSVGQIYERRLVKHHRQNIFWGTSFYVHLLLIYLKLRCFCSGHGDVNTGYRYGATQWNSGIFQVENWQIRVHKRRPPECGQWRDPFMKLLCDDCVYDSVLSSSCGYYCSHKYIIIIFPFADAAIFCCSWKWSWLNAATYRMRFVRSKCPSLGSIVFSKNISIRWVNQKKLPNRSMSPTRHSSHKVRCDKQRRIDSKRMINDGCIRLKSAGYICHIMHYLKV